MSAWAQSGNFQSGKFLGSTGAKILSAEELAPKNKKMQAWTRKVFFWIYYFIFLILKL